MFFAQAVLFTCNWSHTHPTYLKYRKTDCRIVCKQADSQFKQLRFQQICIKIVLLKKLKSENSKIKEENKPDLVLNAFVLILFSFGRLTKRQVQEEGTGRNDQNFAVCTCSVSDSFSAGVQFNCNDQPSDHLEVHQISITCKNKMGSIYESVLLSTYHTHIYRII